MWIFRAWKTTKDGKRIYAKAYGLKAFPIWIDDDSKDNSEEKSAMVSAEMPSLILYIVISHPSTLRSRWAAYFLRFQSKYSS